MFELDTNDWLMQMLEKLNENYQILSVILLFSERKKSRICENKPFSVWAE